MLKINLTERGQPTVISSKDWHAQNLELPFQLLADEGIIKLNHSPSGIIVTPNHFVGELRLPKAILNIAPKSPQIYSAIETLALLAPTKRASDFKTYLVTGKGDDDPANSFVHALKLCVHSGLPWNFVSRTEETSFPRGKINGSATLKRFVSRGILHKIAGRVQHRQQNQQISKIVHTAHLCLPYAPGVTPQTLFEAQLLMASFDTTATFSSIDKAIEAATLIMKTELDKSAVNLIANSLALLTRHYDLAGTLHAVPEGTCHFKNLESLWERCVTRLLECCPTLLKEGSAQLHGLAGKGNRLFEDGGPLIDPDIIIQKLGAITSVIDAKYKRISGKALADDIYQLTCYVERIGCPLGMLVYFGDEGGEAIEIIGTTKNGALIASVVISPNLILSLRDSALKFLLDDKGFAQAFENSVSHFSSKQGTNSVTNLTSNVFFGA